MSTNLPVMLLCLPSVEFENETVIIIPVRGSILTDFVFGIKLGNLRAD